MSEPDLTRFFGGIHTKVDNAVRQLLSHMNYPRSFCFAPVPAH